MTEKLLSIPANLTTSFFSHVNDSPNKTALIEPLIWGVGEKLKERVWSYGELGEVVSHYRLRFQTLNLRPGDKVLIVLPISARLYALIAACFASGIVPIFVDSSISRKGFVRILKQTQPKIIFSTSRLFKFRWVFPFILKQAVPSKLYTLGERTIWSPDFDEIPIFKKSDLPLVKIHGEQTALITFTSGSTGEPKAADRNHFVTYMQRYISSQNWQGHSDMEMTAFPLVVLNNLSAGGQTCLPAMNFTEMDRFSPEPILEQIRRHKIKHLIASPAFFNRICHYLQHTGETISEVEQLITGGAPTPIWLQKKIMDGFPNAKGFVVYGSTEAEPISFIEMKDCIKNEEGKGYLVGRPIPHIKVKIVASQEGESITHWGALAPFVEGEILLSGPHVIKRYLYDHQDNFRTKVTDSRGHIWHRTGDIGYFDREGRIWLTGRVKQRIEVNGVKMGTYPIEHQIENLFAQRASLVELKGHMNLVIQGEREQFLSSDLHVAKALLSNWQLSDVAFSFTEEMPVDSRHFWRLSKDKLAHSKKVKSLNV